MPKGYGRKVCVECKRTTLGKLGAIEWCDCGGELRVIVYRRPKRRTRGSRV